MQEQNANYHLDPFSHRHLEEKFTIPQLRQFTALVKWLCYNKQSNTCMIYVGKLSAMGQPTKPTQPSIPPELGKRVVIHVCTWITEAETIKTADTVT